MSDVNVPDGYMMDGKGRLIPISLIKPVDIIRSEMVEELFESAANLRDEMAEFKSKVFDEISAFCELSATEYGETVGGKKGNMTFLTFNGRLKISVAIADTLVFDERLQIAKNLIDECVQQWLVGARPEIAALINDAFQVDKAGNISTWRVLALRRLDITDEKWVQAMAALNDSVKVQSSKSYVRFYRRVGDTERYEAVSLDFASL